MSTGELTTEALLYLNDLENGQDSDSPGINTVLAGVNTVTATTAAIIAGTQPLVDVLLESVGSVTNNVTALNANTNAAAHWRWKREAGTKICFDFHRSFLPKSIQC